MGGLNARYWPDDPQQYRTLQVPHLVWTDEGARNMNRKVRDIREELALDERGGTEFDGVALYIVKPKVLQIRFLDLPGTTVGSESAAYLRLLDGRPELRSAWVGLALPRFGSLVCDSLSGI